MWDYILYPFITDNFGQFSLDPLDSPRIFLISYSYNAALSLPEKEAIDFLFAALFIDPVTEIS